jgi:hypothetical protein
MSETQTFPHATHLDVKFAPLSLVDVPALVQACTEKHDGSLRRRAIFDSTDFWE